MRVADYIVKRICEAGARHAFLVTGRGVLYLTDALAANKDIETICMHHEQGVTYAAYAYAEYTEKIGVCIVSTGCAATNAITGTMCAWQDEVPLVVISGQNMLKETTYHTGSKIRTYGQQENNIIALVRPITKYAVMVENAKDIGYVMDKAIHEATHGRKGPVWIDVPLDIQNMPVAEEELLRFCPEEEVKKNSMVKEIAEKLSASRRPVLLIGAGVRKADAMDEFLAFQKKVNIPVVYDASATDIFTNEFTLSIGAVGSMSGTRAGNFAIQNSDLVLAIGCRLSTMLTGNEREKFARQAQIVVIDVDEAEMKENAFRDMYLVQDNPKDVLSQLLDYEGKMTGDWSAWVEKCVHWKETFPKNIYKDCAPEMDEIDMYEVAEVLGRSCDENIVAITDAGMEELIFPTTMCLKNGARMIHPVSQGAMGFAIPAIMGAYYASGRQVICVVGDGSVMMNLQELESLRHHDVPAKIFVINNNGYAVIRERQKELFRKRTIGTDSSDGVSIPQFEKVAECFGFDYRFVEQREELEETIADVLNATGPVICEVKCKEQQKFLKNSYAMGEKRKILRRTLEDQAPFLDREIIKNEMLIEPIELE